MTAVWIVLAAICALLVALGFFLAKFSMSIRRQTLEQARAWQAEHYDIAWYDGLEKQDYTIQSDDGYTLHVELLRNPAPSDRYVLISHGYTDNRFGSLKYTRIYLELGFNVILYDLRGHGENEPTFCTYSIRESRDLDTLIRDSRRRYPDAALVGIHGESLGSATSAACLRFKPAIDFVVADCGFSEITSVMQRGLRGMHLPGCLVHLVSLCARIRYGYWIHDMRPIDSLADNTVPMLFIHGEKDDFILPAHSQAMQKATKGYSEIHLIPGAGHAASVLTAPEDYKRYVTDFLNKIVPVKN
ncbi:MAG: alpha/beta fold hydrolase [Clostridia bacterium]|nr:alpha/beta fold hydrolase [Clostridia bacterium]